ncbi:MAG: GNAT family N-acetyltransferase [Pseudomonadota bacterium]|nr:MAG: GNAT family N-acetyltransferase [Pseudomonadota bacterium]
MRAFGEERHRSLFEPYPSPFLSFAWLDALEQTGCVTPESGWMPCHISLHRGEETLAFAPAYVKGNSDGEFVFDQSWARFAERSLGVRYYPKLVLSVPFTPATGPRLLVRSGADRDELLRALPEALRRLVDALGLSSAHVLFPTRDDADVLAEEGLALRTGIQFQWHNAGYATFDDFLSRFTSKRRNQIRRERRDALASGIDIEVLTGSDLGPELASFVHAFYRATVDRYLWGRPYLNQAFFEEVLSRLRYAIELVVARDRASKRRIAGAFNVLGNGVLYGRYWGALEERSFLHFEVCFYRGIERAIAHKVTRFEPGAGGEHKLVRGFAPTPTYSVHHLASPRLDLTVRDFLRRERHAVEREIEEATREMRLKPA